MIKAFSVKFIPIISLFCGTNNTLVSLIRSDKKLLLTISCGHITYKGSKKSTPVASQQVIYSFSKKAIKCNSEKFILQIKGIGKGRRLATKEIKKVGLKVVKIFNTNPVSYNGCRIKKCKR
jgi:small subunit ribosomal protein S11